MKFGDILVKSDGMIKGPFGGDVKKALFVQKSESTYKVYEQGVVSSGDFNYGNYYLPKEYVETKLSRFLLEPGDILITGAGTLGLLVEVPQGVEKGIINQALIRIRLDETIVNKSFFKYFFPYFIKPIACRLNGDSVIPNLPPLSVLKEIEIELPPMQKQEEIASVLSSIDAKIDNNNAICADLEGMAKLLYDYWFVQFDFPDENGKPYKSSGGKMVWNEELKREIPEGWEVLALSAFIKTSKNGDWGNETPQAQDDIKVTCFRGADFPSITSDYSLKAPVRYIKKTNESRILKDGDLVVEISGGSPTQSTGRIGYINSSFLRRTPNEMVCSNFCKAFTLVDTTLQFWFYQTWKRYYDAGAMFHHESKTTGIKNLMFDEFVSEIKVPVPKNRLFQKYAKLTNTLYDKTQECFIEAAELASLRDFLLPMLMNGQVKVKEGA